MHEWYCLPIYRLSFIAHCNGNVVGLCNQYICTILIIESLDTGVVAHGHGCIMMLLQEHSSSSTLLQICAADRTFSCCSSSVGFATPAGVSCSCTRAESPTAGSAVLKTGRGKGWTVPCIPYATTRHSCPRKSETIATLLCNIKFGLRCGDGGQQPAAVPYEQNIKPHYPNTG